MKQTLRHLAEKLGCRLLGDSSITVTRVSSLQSATGESLVFVEDPLHLEAALNSPAAAVIAGDFAASAGPKPILISPQPRLTFARAAKLLRDADHNRAIHPSAIVPASAQIGRNVAIGPCAILGEHVQVGDETTITCGSVIGDNATIGSQCRIDANVTIYAHTTLGDRVIVQSGAVLGQCATRGPQARTQALTTGECGAILSLPRDTLGLEPQSEASRKTRPSRRPQAGTGMCGGRGAASRH